MHRGDLTNVPWERLHPRLPPPQPQTGRPAVDHRRILTGIWWVLRTGAPWHDLPERYGPWRTVASRFYRWRKAGVFQQRFDALNQQADATGQLDWDVHGIDSTIVRAHQSPDPPVCAPSWPPGHHSMQGECTSNRPLRPEQ
jgi:transposase